MATRTARCACGRVEVTMEGEPGLIQVCHCEFCQRRSGSVVKVTAQFDADQVVAVTGETSRYNGLEVDGVGAVGVPGGIDYHFCPTCGSPIYFENVMPHTGRRAVSIAVGTLFDPEFPAPSAEFFTRFRHHWVPPVPGAVQYVDPLDGSVEADTMLSDGDPETSGETGG